MRAVPSAQPALSNTRPKASAEATRCVAKEHARRIVEEMREVQAIAQMAPAELEIGRGKYGDDRDEDADVGPVHLPDAVQDARRPERPAGAVEHPPEGKRRGDAGAEDENLGRVREAEARRDPVRPGVARDMGGEDDEHPDAAEDVEPRIARTLGCRARDGHRLLDPQPAIRPSPRAT